MIMYACAYCAEHSPEDCGHYDRTKLRVMPDGTWVCEYCYDDGAEALGPWESFPHPPEHMPVEAAAEIEALRARCERMTAALQRIADGQDRENCQRYRIEMKMGYPHTCQICGLTGPCRFYPPPLPDPRDAEITRLTAALAEANAQLSDLAGPEPREWVKSSQLDELQAALAETRKANTGLHDLLAETRKALGDAKDELLAERARSERIEARAVEVIARRMAQADGYDPNAVSDGPGYEVPVWMHYEQSARAALAHPSTHTGAAEGERREGE